MPVEGGAESVRSPVRLVSTSVTPVLTAQQQFHSFSLEYQSHFQSTVHLLFQPKPFSRLNPTWHGNLDLLMLCTVAVELTVQPTLNNIMVYCWVYFNKVNTDYRYELWEIRAATVPSFVVGGVQNWT